MKGRFIFTACLAAVATVLLSAGGASATGATTLDPALFGQTLFAAMPAPVDDPTDPPGFFNVKADEFDPGHTNLVQGAWLNGIGCPTGATTATPNADFTGIAGYGTFTDGACPTGDPKDQHNEGLLLVKTGPTGNFASAVAELNRVKGITLTELGWDIRKQGGSASPLGSHCGAGAPRWNIVTTDGVGHFLGCNSPPPTSQTPSATGWTRMRWGAAGLAAAFPPVTPTETVSRIQIVFDEGQDTGPDFFGAAILDNIDVNGALVGQGPVDAD
jgi:hypothetical protein